MGHLVPLRQYLFWVGNNLHMCTHTHTHVHTPTPHKHLHITVAPTINFESTEVVAELGGKFALTCPASGTPTPTIQWRVNGQDIVEAPAFVFDSETGELRLNDPTVDNEGTLTCVATNPVGTASADIELLVRGEFNT